MMGLRMKTFWGSQKNLIFKGGGFTKNQYGGGLPKRARLGQFADLRGGLGKEEGMVFYLAGWG